MKKLSILLQCYNVDSELGLGFIVKIKIYLKVDDIKPSCWSTRDALNPYIITSIPLPNNLNTKSKSTSHENMMHIVLELSFSIARILNYHDSNIDQHFKYINTILVII